MADNTPSINPANEDTLSGAYNHIFNKLQQRIDDMLPAIVISFDRTTNRATVKPLIKILTTSGATVSRANNVNVPVLQLSGGGFMLNFPLNSGDLGWIKASDRDISLFMANYTEAKPNTLRKHSFEDAMFIPDSMTGYSIEGEDANNVVLQKLDGTVKVCLSDDSIKIKAPTKITLKAADIELIATGVEITSTTLTHNGTNVGDTHAHPQDNDSGGNVETDTGGPQ